MNSSFLRARIGCVVVIILGLQLMTCKDQKPTPDVKQVVIKFKKEGTLEVRRAASDSLLAPLDIEIADNDYETQTGLMYRKSMARNQGMLFIFPNSGYRSFYMKNTEIPLDIIYISEEKTVVSIQKNAQPFDETSLPSEGPAKYVLEVNAGLSDQWKLTKGDYISFSLN